MMALTHCAIAAAGVSFALGDVSPLVMGLAVAGSQLPDLDTSTSLIGQVFFPISRLIESRYPHRSITHSLLAVGAIAALSLPLYFYLGLKPWLALWLGHLIACFSDTFTKQGVQLFWPSPAWAVCGSNPNRRLTTGSPSEYWVLAGAIALLVVNFHLINSGGIVQSASQQLGLRSGILDAYNAQAPTHHVYAEVDGVLSIDSSPADGKYFIVAVDGSEFVVANGQGIYKTGEQLIADKLTTSTGSPAKTTIQTLTFDDEEAIAPLTQLQASHPNAAIFLSGTLAVDFPEDIKVTLDPSQYPYFKLTGSNVELVWCPFEKAIALLKGQYAVGTLTAKIITPKPEGF